MPTDPDEVVIYTDGGADPNPGIGGWAAILRYGEHERVLTGSEPTTTNNRMELQAAIEALKALKRPVHVEFYTDSEYLRKGITQWVEQWAARGWKHKGGRAVPNAQLWQELVPLVEKHDINWHWVRGHAGNELNERVDELAREARLAITPQVELADDVPRLFLRSACKGNPGPGGWSVVIERGEETEQYSGGDPSTTNNRMEIMAAIEGLLAVQPGSKVQIFTTSDYLFQGITRWIHGWRQRSWQKRDDQPVANADLWQTLDALTENYQVVWVNAKGQKHDSLEVAGKLAREARDLA